MIQLWCNGNWLDPQEFPASPIDRGATLGLGLFETILAVDGAPVFADLHLSRLRKSGQRLGWEIDIPDFLPLACELLTRNQLTTGRARIRLAITAGSGPFNDLTPGNDRLVWMAAFPAAPAPASLTACLSPWPRNENSPLAGLKCASYAENLLALNHARQRCFDETIFLNTAGHLCESATANLFLVKNGQLLTPPLDSGCLPGIAREVLAEIAPLHGIACQEQPLILADLISADEIFLTSAIRGPIAVTRFEDQTFSPSPITSLLRSHWLAVAGG